MQPTATPTLASTPGPLPASSFFNMSFSGVGAPFLERWGFPWSLQPLWLGQFLGPGFHLLSTYRMPDPKSCISLTSIVPLSPHNLLRSEASPHLSFEEVETHRH